MALRIFVNQNEILPLYSCDGGESLRPSESTGTIWNFNPGGGGLLSWRLSKIALISPVSSLRTSVAMMIGWYRSVSVDIDRYRKNRNYLSFFRFWKVDTKIYEKSEAFPSFHFVCGSDNTYFERQTPAQRWLSLIRCWNRQTWNANGFLIWFLKGFWVAFDRVIFFWVFSVREAKVLRVFGAKKRTRLKKLS